MKRNLEQELDEVKLQLSEIMVLLEKSCQIEVKKTEDAIEKNVDTDMSKETDTSGGACTIIDLDARIDIDGLLCLIENQTVERVLSCIGNSDRLQILLTLLKEPMTVAKLIETCGYNSTGQVYHHLKPLVAADLVTEDRKVAKGIYMVQPSRVQGILMFLSGISHLTFEITSGTWGSSTEIHQGATMVDERYMTTAVEVKKTISTYFASENPLVLKSFPARQKKKIIVLGVIAKQFVKDRQYRDKEVDEILSGIFEDYATIRRYLIEYGFMKRTQDGSLYWLT